MLGPFFPKGNLTASIRFDTIVLLELGTGREVHKLAGHKDWVTSVALSPDGKWLASGGQDQTLRLWETATGKEVFRHEGRQGRILSLAFSRDGARLASAADDTTVLIWSVPALLAKRP